MNKFKAQFFLLINYIKSLPRRIFYFVEGFLQTIYDSYEHLTADLSIYRVKGHLLSPSVPFAPP